MVCLVFSVRAQLPPDGVEQRRLPEEKRPFSRSTVGVQKREALAYLLDADLNTSGFGVSSAAPPLLQRSVTVGDRGKVASRVKRKIRTVSEPTASIPVRFAVRCLRPEGDTTALGDDETTGWL